jgi:hypothetical protein
VERGPDGFARIDQVGKQALVDMQIAFIFSAIPEVMAPGKNPPHLGTETERVREHLKDDVSVRGTISGVAQRREAQRVRGVVGEVESTLQGIRWLLRIGKSPEAGLLESGELLRVRRLIV